MKRAASIALCLCAAMLCSWVWKPKRVSADQLPVPTVTFDNEIVRILDNHCVMCHREGGLSFPLETYEQTFLKMRDIRVSTLNRHMPPWAAVSGYGEFANHNGLTLREVQYVVSWVDGMGPRSSGQVFLNVIDPKAVPQAAIKTHFDPAHWDLGKPDTMLTIAGNTASEKAGTARRFVVATGLTADRWLKGVEFQPGDGAEIHAATFRVEESGQWIGSWTPWYGFFQLPKNLAVRLPAGAHIEAEIQTDAHGNPAQEAGSLGMYFAAQPSERNVSDVVLTPKCDSAAAGHSAKCRATSALTGDTSVIAILPSVQPGLQSIEVDAREPDGAVQVLLFAKDIDPAWQTPYILEQPLTLAKGTELSVTEYLSAASSPTNAEIPVTLCTFAGSALNASQTAAQPTVSTPEPSRRFAMTGTVKSVDAAGHSLVIQHGDIPGFMDAMTMSYRVNTNEDLTAVAPGDEISGEIVVTGDSYHLENVRVVRHAP